MTNELYFEKGFIVYIGEWDYEYRNPEACEPSDNIATSYYAQIGDKDGNTWVHNYLLRSEGMGLHWQDCKEQIQKVVDCIQEHLDQGKPINLNHWREGSPMYGSKAWQKWDQEELQPAVEYMNSGGHIDNLPDSVRAWL